MRGFVLQFNLSETRLNQLYLTVTSIEAVYGLKGEESMGYDMVSLQNNINQELGSKYTFFSTINMLPPGLEPTSLINCKISITLQNSLNTTKKLEHTVFDIKLRKKMDNDLVILPIDHPFAIPEFFEDFYEANLYAHVDPYNLSVEFVKAPYADWHQTANQDRISSNLWITRMDKSVLINYKYWSTQTDPNTNSNYFLDQKNFYDFIKDIVWEPGDIGVLGNAKVLLDTTMVKPYTQMEWTEFMKSSSAYGYNQSVGPNPNPNNQWNQGFNSSILSSLPGGVPQLGNKASYKNPNAMLLESLNYLRSHDKTGMRQFSEISNQLYIFIRDSDFTDPANKKITFELWTHPTDAYIIKDYESYEEAPQVGDVFYYTDYWGSLEKNDGTGVSDTKFFSLRSRISGPSTKYILQGGYEPYTAENLYEYFVDTDMQITDLLDSMSYRKPAIDILPKQMAYSIPVHRIWITKRTPHVTYFQNIFMEDYSAWCARSFGCSMEHFVYNSDNTNTKVLGDTGLYPDYGMPYIVGIPLLIYIPEEDKYIRLIIDEWYAPGTKNHYYFGSQQDATGSFKYRRSELFSINSIDEKFVADANGVSDYYNMNTNKTFSRKTTIRSFSPTNTISEGYTEQDVVNNDVTLVADDYGLIFNYKLVQTDYIDNPQYDTNNRQTYMGIQSFANYMNSDGHKEIYYDTDVLFGIENFNPWCKDYFVPLENMFVVDTNTGGWELIDSANLDNTAIHITRNVNKEEFKHLFARHGDIESFMSFKKMWTIATNCRYRPGLHENHPLNVDPTDMIVDAAYNESTLIWEAHWKSGAKTSNNHKMLLLGLPIIGYLPAVNQYFKLRLNFIGISILYNSNYDYTWNYDQNSFDMGMDGDIEWIRSGLFREDWNIPIDII